MPLHCHPVPLLPSGAFHLLLHPSISSPIPHQRSHTSIIAYKSILSIKFSWWLNQALFLFFWSFYFHKMMRFYDELFESTILPHVIDDALLLTFQNAEGYMFELWLFEKFPRHTTLVNNLFTLRWLCLFIYPFVCARVCVFLTTLLLLAPSFILNDIKMRERYWTLFDSSSVN